MSVVFNDNDGDIKTEQSIAHKAHKATQHIGHIPIHYSQFEPDNNG